MRAELARFRSRACAHERGRKQSACKKDKIELMQRIYLDNNATTPLLPEALAAMLPYFGARFGNASSIHQVGQQARAAVEQVRQQVASLLGARTTEIVFTSGGTEGDNTALFGLLAPGDHLIVSAIEHHAVLLAAERLEQMGVAVTRVGCDADGVVAVDAVRAALRPQTKLISVMLANNETGVLQPVAALGQLAREHGICLHTDAVQAAGKIAIDVETLGCHLLTVAAHKMHGPQGVGALYVRRGTLLRPLLVGGRQERQRRAGTENLAAIVGFGCAAQLAQTWLTNGGAESLRALRDRLERGLVALPGVRVHGAEAERVPNTTNVAFDGIDGEGFVIAMDLKGVAVSSGAACSSGAVEPSHVLTAMGLNDAAARSSIRFSLGKQTTIEEIDAVLAWLPEVVAKLRELSPSWSTRR